MPGKPDCVIGIGGCQHRKSGLFQDCLYQGEKGGVIFDDQNRF
jgi:hypothetical protein